MNACPEQDSNSGRCLARFDMTELNGTRRMAVTNQVKLAILDDYQKLALGYADWDKARARGVEITAFDRHLGTTEQTALDLAPFDVVLLLRERQPMPKALIDRLP